MGTCEHCDSVGIVTLGGRLLCHEHALQAIAEKERRQCVQLINGTKASPPT
jgi:hypothetical protein